MKILCTQEFPGDVRMLGSVADAAAEIAPEEMEFVKLPPLASLAASLPLLRSYVEDADALLTCHLWAPATLRAMFSNLPLVFMPHNACPVKAHYWFPQVLEAADALLVTGESMRRKTELLKPAARVVDIPYPRLPEYRRRAAEAGEPEYDLVFACTSYLHYAPLMGIPESGAHWHQLVGDLAARGWKVAVLRHQDDRGLDEIEGVHYFDQPNPRVLFAGRAVVSDIASNGLMAAAVGRPVFQVVDRRGRVEPRLASHRGFLPELFDIGPRFGCDWGLETLGEMYPFTDRRRELHDTYQERVADHIHRDLAPAEFYTRLAETVSALRSPSPAFA